MFKRFTLHSFWSAGRGARRGGPAESGRRPRQIADADQVVDRSRKCKDPFDLAAAAMPQLPEQADALHPAKRLLDLFPFALTDRVAGVPGRPRIDIAPAIDRVLRN